MDELDCWDFILFFFLVDLWDFGWCTRADKIIEISPGILTLDHNKWSLILDSYHTYGAQRKQTIRNSQREGGNIQTCIFLLWSNKYCLYFSLIYVDRKFRFYKFQVHFLFWQLTIKLIKLENRSYDSKMGTNDGKGNFVVFLKYTSEKLFLCWIQGFFSNKDKLAMVDSTTPPQSPVKCTLKIRTWKCLLSLSFGGLCPFHSNS